MSSYLHFYLMPQKATDKDKPLLFTSYNRSSPVYQRYWEEIHPVYSENEVKYTELTSSMAKDVANAARKELERAKDAHNNAVEAFQRLTNITNQQVNEYIGNYKDSKEFIQELEEEVVELETISQWVSEIEFSDFQKVLINIG